MIIVTGANGFIGSMIVWQLNELGIQSIIATDSVPLTERNILKKRKYSRFLDKSGLLKFLEQPEAQKVQWVIHMGACSSTTEKNWEFLLENNTHYTQKLFDWCAEHGKSMIYASSAATYGAGELGFDDKIDSEKLKPLNLYGDSKVLFDRYALKASKTPQHWYGLRFFNVFGPNEYHKEDMSSVAYKAFHQINSTGELKLFRSANAQYADGDFSRDFVYVKDIVRWIAELMDKKPQSGLYNMGFGQSRSWNDLAKALFAAMKKDVKINWIEMPESVRNQYQYYTEAKTDKWIEQGLSAPQWPLEKAIADYVTQHLQNSDPLV